MHDWPQMNYDSLSDGIIHFDRDQFLMPWSHILSLFPHRSSDLDDITVSFIAPYSSLMLLKGSSKNANAFERSLEQVILRKYIRWQIAKCMKCLKR